MLVGIAMMRLGALASLVAFGWFFVRLAMAPNPDLGYAALGSLFGYAFLRVAAFAKAQTLSCPLCHGTVLHSKSCHKHRDAHRFPLLGYVWTAIIDVLCRWSFRCMYCGTSFRLKK